MTEALSVVHVLVSGKPTEDGLPQHADKGMPAILASAVVGQDLARHRRQPERVVKFAIRQQSGIGGHDRTAKLQHQAAVEIEPQSPIV